jgi:hypothetical protein
MKWGSLTWDLDEDGGHSGQAKTWRQCVMNRAHNRKACSCRWCGVMKGKVVAVHVGASEHQNIVL